MKQLSIYISLIFIFLSGVFSNMRAQFVNFGPARQFIELDVHAQVGGTGVFQNYMKKFTQIKELNTNSGTSFGIGARAVLNVSNFLGFGTELNFNLDGYSLDMAVTDDAEKSVSNIYLRNRFLYANLPVFMSFRFNASSSVRMNVDIGFYYQLGLSGSQKQSIYSSKLNELGQLVPQTVYSKPNYFSSDETFINSFKRGDLGFHLAIGLTFINHINVSVKSEFGCKNIASTTGIVNPIIRNYGIMAALGYQF